ncbi:MAG: winged helix-turn-helix domain-containing protein [Candidatus Thermoplasmatota archaeon]
MPNWDLISFVLASEIRFKILLSLNKKIQTPTELKKEFGVPISRISTVLRELSEKKLITNLTPERRKSRMYSITKFGKEILKEIHEITGGEANERG